MGRVRRAGIAALALVLSVGVAPGVPSAQAAVVDWPPSTLVIAELQTGGASASDEFVEIANQGPAAGRPGIGLELVYATSTGSTVTRKASSDRARSALRAGPPDPRRQRGRGATGRRPMRRIRAGSPRPAAPSPSAPFGGAGRRCRRLGRRHQPLRRRTAAPAPPAGSSLERRPGGAAGNGVDTNDNAADVVVSGSPNPQGLAAAPVPARVRRPHRRPGDADHHAGADRDPNAEPTATPTAPTPTPTVAPTPTCAHPTRPQPTPSPTPTPILDIATARTLADGTAATVRDRHHRLPAVCDVGRRPVHRCRPDADARSDGYTHARPDPGTPTQTATPIPTPAASAAPAVADVERLAVPPAGATIADIRTRPVAGDRGGQRHRSAPSTTRSAVRRSSPSSMTGGIIVPPAG